MAAESPDNPQSSQHALWQCEQRFRELAEMLPEIVFETDAGGVLKFINQRAFELTGYDRADVDQGLGALELLAPEDRPRAAATIGQVLGGEPSPGNEYTALRKDGSRYPVLVRSAPIRRDGEVVGLRGVVLDISRHKQAELALKQSEERLHSLLEQAEECILVVDASGAIRYRSPSNARVLGYGNDDPLGSSAFELIHPEDQAKIKRTIEVLLEHPKEARRSEFRLQHADGSWRVMESCARNLLHDPRIGGILINYRDVTETRRQESLRLRAEQEKRALEQDLLHAQKLEAVGRLAGGIAHDFNNLLTAISGNVSLALMDVAPGHPAHDSLQEIVASVGRATRLTRQLLTFGKRQPFQPTVLDLNRLVADLTTIVSRLIGEDVSFETVLARPCTMVRADAGQLEQVIVNLAVNARDAMPDGGVLTIETTTVPRPPSGLAGVEGLRHRGPYALLVVRDNGCGMDDATRRRAFDPFFTTKARDRGTGLGLSTVYGIVQQHQGLVELESSPASGCTVRVYLPQPETSSQPTPHGAGSPPVQLPRGDEEVLLVEDDPAVNRVVCSLLRSLGYRVHCALDASQAEALAEQHGSTLRLLLTDVVLPGINGRVLAERLKAMLPTLKVIYASGYDETVVAHHGIAEEEPNFISKPYSLAALARKVREALDGS